MNFFKSEKKKLLECCKKILEFIFFFREFIWFCSISFFFFKRFLWDVWVFVFIYILNFCFENFLRVLGFFFILLRFFLIVVIFFWGNGVFLGVGVLRIFLMIMFGLFSFLGNIYFGS